MKHPIQDSGFNLVLRTLCVVIPLAFGMAGCQAQTPSSSTSKPAKALTEQQATALQALVAKTKKNLVLIEGGSFQMGDFGPLHNEEKLPYYGHVSSITLHKVTLDSFSMSAYKTTYEDYDLYSDIHGLKKLMQDTRDIYSKRRTAPAGVQWKAARAYCQWLGQQVGTPLDLPTEAQWEYAARNRGQFVVFATDNGKLDMGRNLPTYEWLREHNINPAMGTSFASSMYEVGLFPPTPLGLYDMASNGFDWVLDWYDPAYYSKSPELNPQGPATGIKKVQRGNENMSQKSLEIQGMTIVRHSSDLTSNLNDGDHIRCVANSLRKIE
jgi:formylglycine-generating enzyme required for sulfatase activity